MCINLMKIQILCAKNLSSILNFYERRYQSVKLNRRTQNMVSASKRKFKEYKRRLQHFANEDDAEHKFNSALEQQTSARSFAMPLHLDHCARSAVYTNNRAAK